MSTATEDSRFNYLEIDNDIPAAPAPAPGPSAEDVEKERATRERETHERILAQRVAARAAQAPVVLKPPAALVDERISAKNLIAVEDMASSTGTMTYWHLPGTVDEGKLSAAWEAEGLTISRPVTPSNQVALHRACKEQASKSRLLRSHPEGGWVLVDERRTKGEDSKQTLAYEVGTRIRLSEASPGKPEQILITPRDATEEAMQAAREVGAKVRADYNKIREEIASVDVSVWLVKYVGGLGGVALRESGGFYFVPKSRAEELAKVARALAGSSSHTVYEIPVMQGSKTVRAVLDGLRIEVAQVVKVTESELSDTEGMGARAARNRAEEIGALVTKVEGYAQLFGVPLTDVVSQLGALRTKLEIQTTRGAQLEVD